MSERRTRTNSTKSMAERAARERTDWAYVVIDALIFCVTITGFRAFFHMTQVVDTIGDLGAGHSYSAIVSAAAAVLTVPMLVASGVEAARSKNRPVPTWQEEQEERRAWLVDLREQGAPRRERLAQWLSLVVFAAPVLALRRVLRGTSPRPARQLVHGAAVAGVIGTVIEAHDLDLLNFLCLVAGAVLFDRVACFFVGVRERRKARRWAQMSGTFRPAP